MTGFEKLVLVTRKTRLSELVERYNTRAQAKFYLTQAGLSFEEYQAEDDAYRASLDLVRAQAGQFGLKLQVLDRALVSTYFFAPCDLVVTLGQDGLVANTAKYIGAQPLVGVNPDPARFTGVLLPWSPANFADAVAAVLRGRDRVKDVTLAEVRLSDGQKLLAFNDVFLGARTHVSARYQLDAGGGFERQSSSGVLVSTGAGSTGWLSSMRAMAQSVSAFWGGAGPVEAPRFDWGDPRLVYVVREPYQSRWTSTTQTMGWLDAGHPLKVESQMPSGGVIFSDGMEEDFLSFHSGTVAEVGPAAQRARLVVPAA